MQYVRQFKKLYVKMCLEVFLFFSILFDVLSYYTLKFQHYLNFSHFQNDSSSSWQLSILVSEFYKFQMFFFLFGRGGGATITNDDSTRTRAMTVAVPPKSTWRANHYLDKNLLNQTLLLQPHNYHVITYTIPFPRSHQTPLRGYFGLGMWIYFIDYYTKFLQKKKIWRKIVNSEKKYTATDKRE